MSSLGQVSEPRSIPKPGEPGISPIALVFLGVGLVVALALAWLGRVILLLLFAAVVVAVVLTALVDWLKATFKLSRSAAFGLILVLSAALLTLTIWLVGPRIIDQFAILQADLPQALHQIMDRVKGSGWGSWLLAQWSGSSQVAGNLTSTLTRIGGFVISTATLLAGLVLIGVLGLYLAAEPGLYLSIIQRTVPVRYRERLNACLASAVSNLRWWLMAQMLSMAAVGTLVAIGLWALGIPLAVTLGAIAALLTFIPNVGPILSAIPAVLLAIAISPVKGLLTVALFMLVHFLEGNLITPLLQRRIIRLPPAMTMSGQLFLAVVAGPFGVALAAPLIAAFLGVLDVLRPPESIQPSKVTQKESGD